jgi:hypothetical protein
VRRGRDCGAALVARAARANRCLHVRVDHDDLPRVCRSGAVRGADASPRRRARSMGIRPQRRLRAETGQMPARASWPS